jgi:hypothetical protein
MGQDEVAVAVERYVLRRLQALLQQQRGLHTALRLRHQEIEPLHYLHMR